MVTYRKRGPDLVFRNTTDHPILVMTSNNGRGGVGVYIFNRPGYAPSHQPGPYTSTVSAPQVTLNPDGSVDAVITRSVTVRGHTTQDQLASHAVPIDP
jgi:vancomycin resistance protein YoaR